MKHPIRDRIVILLCALCALCGAAAGVLLTAGRISLVPAIELLGRINNNVGASLKIKAALIVCALVARPLVLPFGVSELLALIVVTALYVVASNKTRNRVGREKERLGE